MIASDQRCWRFGRTIQPRENHYFVRLRDAAEKSAGGVYLPDNWQENWTDGVVEAVGPGLAVTDTEGSVTYAPMWADVGDVVVFQKHDFTPFGEGFKTGAVKDHELIGTVAAFGEHFCPHNDWVMVSQDPEIERDGTLHLPELYYQRPMSGTIVDFGPGRVRRHGKLQGTRESVRAIFNLPREIALRGLRVYWDREVEVLACGREALEFLLVKAGDLYAYEA